MKNKFKFIVTVISVVILCQLSIAIEIHSVSRVSSNNAQNAPANVTHSRMFKAKSFDLNSDDSGGQLAKFFNLKNVTKSDVETRTSVPEVSVPVYEGRGFRQPMKLDYSSSKNIPQYVYSYNPSTDQQNSPIYSEGGTIDRFAPGQAYSFQQYQLNKSRGYDYTPPKNRIPDKPQVLQTSTAAPPPPPPQQPVRPPPTPPSLPPPPPKSPPASSVAPLYIPPKNLYSFPPNIDSNYSPPSTPVKHKDPLTSYLPPAAGFPDGFDSGSYLGPVNPKYLPTPDSKPPGMMMDSNDHDHPPGPMYVPPTAHDHSHDHPPGPMMMDSNDHDHPPGPMYVPPTAHSHDHDHDHSHDHPPGPMYVPPTAHDHSHDHDHDHSHDHPPGPEYIPPSGPPMNMPPAPTPPPKPAPTTMNPVAQAIMMLMDNMKGPKSPSPPASPPAGMPQMGHDDHPEYMDHPPDDHDHSHDHPPMSAPDHDHPPMTAPDHDHDHHYGQYGVDAFPEVIYDYDPHHHHHDHPTEPPPTTTPAPPPPPEPRVKKYSYYYLGRKLWYVPLYFTVYFTFYVASLIIQSIARHKVNYPNHVVRRSVRDLSHKETTEKVERLTNFVMKQIEEFKDKYVY